jgi:cytochrome P450
MDLIEGHTPIAPPPGVPIWDIDPYDDAILTNPTAYYAELRAKGPFVYIPKYSVLACGRYAETREVFSDHERFVSSRGVGLLDFKIADPWRPPSIVLEVDPPEHSRTRRAIMRALSPKAVAGMREMFREDAEALVDQLLTRDAFDLVDDLAEVYPTTVFPKAVGLREVNKDYLVSYGAIIFNSLGPDNASRRAGLQRLPAVAAWIMAQCQRAQLLPGGFGASLYETADKGELTHDEAGLLVRSLLSAGVDTTVTGIGNALWCLAQNPAQFAKLKDDPSKARNAFEEAMRLTSPVHTFCRTAGGATEVSGVPIAEGTKILCVLGAANLDPDKFENPEAFDVERKLMGHLALGAGVHSCVGQNVARAEGDAILTAIAQRVDRIEALSDAVWRPNNAIHALDRMGMRFHSA